MSPWSQPFNIDLNMTLHVIFVLEHDIEYSYIRKIPIALLIIGVRFTLASLLGTTLAGTVHSSPSSADCAMQ